MELPKPSRGRDDSLSAKAGEAWKPESVVGPIRKRAEGSFPWSIIFLLGLVAAVVVATILWSLKTFEWWVEQVGDGFALDLGIVISVWALITCVLGYWRRVRRRSADAEGQPEA